MGKYYRGMTDLEDETAEQKIPYPNTPCRRHRARGQTTGEGNWLPRTTGVEPESHPAASPLVYPRQGETSTNHTTFMNT